MKTKLKDQIKDLLNISKKPDCFMKIFIQKSTKDEPVFYKSVPNETDINVNVTSEVNADKLISYLTWLENAASKNPKITSIEYIVPKE
jgi:hypothetical protein